MTKPPVPGSGSQASPKSSGSNGKSSASTSTSASASNDTSDPTQAPAGVRTVPELVQPSQAAGAGAGARSERNGQGGSGTDGGAACPSDPSQSLSPPPGPSLGLASPIPSPLRGLSASPRVRMGSEDLPDVISVIDGECCCKLGQTLVSCYGFSREGGVAGVWGFFLLWFFLYTLLSLSGKSGHLIPG